MPQPIPHRGVGERFSLREYATASPSEWSKRQLLPQLGVCDSFHLRKLCDSVSLRKEYAKTSPSERGMRQLLPQIGMRQLLPLIGVCDRFSLTEWYSTTSPSEGGMRHLLPQRVYVTASPSGRDLQQHLRQRGMRQPLTQRGV